MRKSENCKTSREAELSFTVLFQDEEVAKVILSSDKKKVEIIKLIPDGIKQPFGGARQDLARVYDFLKSRCYENDRADLETILATAGMSSNNPWQWVKKTHGVTYEDFFWIRFENESLTWNEVRIR